MQEEWRTFISVCIYIVIVQSFKNGGKNPLTMYLTLLQINKAQSQEESLDH